MRAYKRVGSRGFTLVELMIVVAIVGVLAALAIFGVLRYMASAKTAEAKNTIGRIANDAKASYERENAASEIVADGANSAAATNALCLSAANPVPQGNPPGKVKYQPQTGAGLDFDAGDSRTGWKCLRFTMTDPIYYQYHYNQGGNYVSAGLPGAPDPTATGFEAAAKGDLDGDGIYSVFARGGTVTASGQLKMATNIFVDNELE